MIPGGEPDHRGGSGKGHKTEEEGEGEGEGKRYYRSGAEDARQGVTPTSDQQPQPPQDSTPERDHRIMRRSRGEGQDRGGRRRSKRGQETLQEQL